jgi:3-oxoacyl-(acyl-carrier-protein) synthase
MLKGINNIHPYQRRDEHDGFKGKYGATLHKDYKEEEYLTSFGPIRIFSLTNALGKNALIDSFGSIENLPNNT